ncbi:hypothetical protein [Arthrobacter sp. NPDC058127]|uniref:hypothetical protein n=1 Tax=Arthrobacter sp. NPDC058127 TaxID=3346351 RepID=UPI0036EDB47A
MLHSSFAASTDEVPTAKPLGTPAGSAAADPTDNLAGRWSVRTVDIWSVLKSQSSADGWLKNAALGSPRISLSRELLHVLLAPDGRLDPALLSWTKSLQRAPETGKSSAGDIAIFLNYLHSHLGIEWRAAERDDISSFLEWRAQEYSFRRRGEVRNGVSAGTIARNLASLNSMYGHAVDKGFIKASPIPRRREGSPAINAGKGQTISDVKWVTRRAFWRWRSEALLGQANAHNDSVLMMAGRNSSYADLLYSTGMRRAEAAGLLTFEVAQRQSGNGLFRGRIPASLSKGKPARGRLYYFGPQIRDVLVRYTEQDRAVEELHGIQSGLYEGIENALIATRLHRLDGIAESITYTDSTSGEVTETALDKLALSDRRRLYSIDENGARRPLFLWLGYGGGPMATSTWNDVFDAANSRMARIQTQEDSAGIILSNESSIRIHPHMLRHSFALHAFALAAMIELRRMGIENRRGLQQLVSESNIWVRIQALLGHKDVETTRKIYLAPVQTIEWEWFATAFDPHPRDLDAALTLIAQTDSRVMDVDH